MEEKVYQRTVTKLAVAHRVVDKHQVTRHYKLMDLHELYSCRPSADVERPISNVPEDKVLAKLMLRLPCIFKHHEHRALLEDRPEDNLNEQELNAAWDEFKRIKDAPREFFFCFVCRLGWGITEESLVEGQVAPPRFDLRKLNFKVYLS